MTPEQKRAARLADLTARQQAFLAALNARVTCYADVTPEDRAAATALWLHLPGLPLDPPGQVNWGPGTGSVRK